MHAQRASLSRPCSANNTSNYPLKRLRGFARFVHDGRTRLTNNVEKRRGLRWEETHGCAPAPIAGPSPVMAMLIMTARLNNIDPNAWFADVFGRIAIMSQS